MAVLVLELESLLVLEKAETYESWILMVLHIEFFLVEILYHINHPVGFRGGTHIIGRFGGDFIVWDEFLVGSIWREIIFRDMGYLIILLLLIVDIFEFPGERDGRVIKIHETDDRFVE